MDKDEVKDTKSCDCGDCKRMWHHHHHHGGHGGSCGGFYFFGFVAALFYFLQHASTSSEYLWGIGKAIVWPALVIFKVLVMLHI